MLQDGNILLTSTHLVDLTDILVVLTSRRSASGPSKFFFPKVGRISKKILRRHHNNFDNF